MKVSIIVPVYNGENVLHYCVESILAQTYEDFELLLIDDGSTDKSGELCDKYAEEYAGIKAIHIENSGVSKARNTGIERAKGDYICFVDSDDYVSKYLLEELVNSIKDNCSFALTAYHWVSDYNKTSYRTVCYEEKEYSKIDKNNLMDISNLVLLSQPWNKIFKRNIIINNNIRMPEDISLGEDTTFVYKYLSCIIDETFTIINKPLYYYYNSPDNDSLLNKYRNNLFEINTKLNNYLNQEVHKWNLSAEQLQLFYNACYYRMESVLFNTFRKENNETKTEKIKYNNNIIKSCEFIKWYKLFNGHINPIFRFAFLIKKYYPIYWLLKLKGR